jgi:hypothetical protein
MRRTARTRPGAQAHEQRRTYKGRLVVLALAIVLSLVAGLQAWRLWSNLPGVRLARLTRADYQRAQREAEAGMSRQARQGLIAANVSHLFTSVLQNPEVYPATFDTLQRMLSELPDTQLGRLQLAAFLMLEMERAAVPVGQWWPRLAPVLSGLEQAQFSHFLAPLEDNRTDIYHSLGLSAGAARAQAEEIMGQPHGPLLQYLAPRLARLAQSRAAYNDGSDVLCRRLLFKLLRQWTLDDGPPGVRLLAADLLAQAITAGDVPILDPVAGAKVAVQLRQWREAYRSAAAAHPPLPYPLAVGQVPDLYPELSSQFATTLPFRMWMLGAMLAAVLVGAVALTIARGEFLSLPRRTLNYALLAAVASAFVLGGWAWAKLGGAVVADDVRRLVPGTGGPPWTPILGFSLLALLLISTALPHPGARPPRRARAGRVAAIAVWACMLLGVYSLPFSDWISPDHIGGRGDRIARVAGDYYVHLLDALQAWQP